MRIKKLVSILLTALLVTQIFNFSVLAADEQPENLIQTAVSEYLAANGYEELTDDNVFGVLVENETGEKVSNNSYVHLMDGNYSTMLRSAVNARRNKFRLSVNLQKKRMFNRVVFYETFIKEKGSTSIKSFEISVADTYVDDEAAFSSENAKSYDAFTDVKTLTAADYTYTTELVEDGTGMKHTIVLNNFANNQYVILQTVATATAYGTSTDNAGKDKPQFSEFELYYDEPENIVQAAAEQYLAALAADKNTQEDWDTSAIDGTNMYGTAAVPGLFIKNETGRRQNGDYDANYAVDNDYSTYFLARINDTTTSSTKTLRLSLNLQKERLFNKLVVYEKNSDGATASLFGVDSGVMTIMVSNEYTNDGADYVYKEPGDFGEFGNNKIVMSDDDITHICEEITDGYKHTITFDSSMSGQYVSFQVKYTDTKTSPRRPAIAELELYYEPILDEVTVTEADGKVTAEVKGSGLTSDYADTTLILAEYEDEGKALKNVNLVKINISNGSATITASLSKVEGRTYKAFLLKGLSSLIPLQAATPLAN